MVLLIPHGAVFYGLCLQFVFGQKCFMDGKLTYLPDILSKAGILTLPNNTCLVLAQKMVNTYQKAERICKENIFEGTLMKPGLFAVLNATVNPRRYYNIIPSAVGHYLWSENETRCAFLVAHVVSPIQDAFQLEYGDCSRPYSFSVCMYKYQYRCAYDVRALENDNELTYHTLVQANDDNHNEICANKSVPSAVPCPNARYNDWQPFSPCSVNCTTYRSRLVKCSNDVNLTAYHNKSCNVDEISCIKANKTTTAEATTWNTTTAPPAVNYLVVATVSIAVVVVILAIVALAVFLILRNRRRNSRGGASTTTGSEAGEQSAKKREEEAATTVGKKSVAKATSKVASQSQVPVVSKATAHSKRSTSPVSVPAASKRGGSAKC